MCVLIQKSFGDDKKNYQYSKFLGQIKILLLNMLKFLEIGSFLFKILGFSNFFSPNCQIPGKMVTL